VAGPGVVTPNGDGVDDALTLTYTLSAAAPVTVTILAGTTPVATAFSGNQAKGAQTLTWAPPAELPDGSYTASVVTPKNSMTAPFIVDRTLGGLSATPALFSPNGDGRLDATSVAYTLAQPASVAVRIEQAGALVADLGTQSLPAGPQQLPWDGTSAGARVADGSYDAVVAATDSLTTVTQTVPLVLDTTAPVVKIVSFAKLRFHTSEAANVIAVVNGKRIALVVRAGIFRVPFTGKPRTLILIAGDAAGNRSRLQKR
jgi:flagellar hook assembly protein FlgD